MKTDSKVFLQTAEAAELLRISQGTMSNWRIRGQGPPYIKAGGRVLYDREALLAWARGRVRHSTSDEVEATR